MAVTKYLSHYIEGTYGVDRGAYANCRPEDRLSFYCDTEAELPETDVQDNDFAYTYDSKKRWVRTGGAWVVRTTDNLANTLMDASGDVFPIDNIADGEYLKRVGTSISSAAIVGGGDMLKADNLSGLANYATAWTNMGISSAATHTSSYFAISTHVHSASDITSSTLALARMGGGTTNVSTFLNGTGNFSQPVYGSLAGLPASPPWMSTVFATSIKFSTTTSSLAFPELAFAVSTGLRYKFEFGIVFATTISTTGLKLSALFPAASTWAATARIPIAADGAGGEFQGWITASGDTVTGTAIQAASTKYYAEVRGVIVPSSDGNLQLTYGTEVAGSAVSTFVGSYGILTQY